MRKWVFLGAHLSASMLQMRKWGRNKSYVILMQINDRQFTAAAAALTVLIKSMVVRHCISLSSSQQSYRYLDLGLSYGILVQNWSKIVNIWLRGPYPSREEIFYYGVQKHIWRLQGENNTCPIFKKSKILVLGQWPRSKLSTENIIWVKKTLYKAS